MIGMIGMIGLDRGVAGRRGEPRTRGIAGLVLAVLAVVGCGTPDQASRPAATAGLRVAVNRVSGDKLVAGAIAAVSRLDDFDEQRAYEQAFDRLSQWSHLTAAEAPGWRIDPLVATVRPDLRTGVEAVLEQPAFDARGDISYLRDRRWLADIAEVARGDAVNDLAVATRLFEWTIRSLAIVGDPPMVPTAESPGTRWYLPGEILLTGRASGAQRSWLFVELARQAGIDAVMLATGDAASGNARAWLPAVISGGEAYLFEPTYGMPVPGPAGQGVATARQAAADPAILEADRKSVV